MEILTILINCLIAGLLTSVGLFGVKIVKMYVSDYWIEIAVAWAEQTLTSSTGSEKLQAVEDYLASKNISVTTEQIESAVYWVKSKLVDANSDEESEV